MNNGNDIVTEIANIYQNEVLTEKVKANKSFEGAEKLTKTNVKNPVSKAKCVDATTSTAKDKKTIKENTEDKGMANESKFDQLFNKAKASILNEEDAPIVSEDPDAVVNSMDDTDNDVPATEEAVEGEEDEIDIADALQEIMDRLGEIVGELRGEEEAEEAVEGEEMPIEDETSAIADEGSIGEAVSNPTPRPAGDKGKKLMTKANKVGSVKQAGGKAKVPGMKPYSQKTAGNKHKSLQSKCQKVKSATGTWGK
jgi:hypothetical protein